MRIHDLLAPKDLSRVAKLQLLARQVVEGFCSGKHRSPHKGFSVEFKGHRSYVRGDEIRRIDWKLYAKTDRLFIREFEEETNLRCTLLVDASGSMAYQGGRSKLSKHQYAVRLAACMAYMMLQQQDSAGLVTFDTKMRHFVPPRSRPKHLKAIVDSLDLSKPGGETELGSVFHKLASKLHRRGLIVIFSDLFGDVEHLLRALAHFRHAKHEIIIFQIWDPDELDFPFRQWMQFTSLEDEGHRHMVDPAQIRRTYMSNLDAFREQLTSGCHRHKISLVQMRTDEPYADALAAYLAMRRRAP